MDIEGFHYRSSIVFTPPKEGWIFYDFCYKFSTVVTSPEEEWIFYDFHYKFSIVVTSPGGVDIKAFITDPQFCSPRLRRGGYFMTFLADSQL